MKVIYIKYSDVYNPSVTELLTTYPHIGYTKYDLLPIPSMEIPKIQPLNIYDSEDIEEFEESFEDNQYIICRLLVTNYVAKQIAKRGINCIFMDVDKHTIDQFLLLNQGDTKALHEEILNIAIKDGTDQEMVEYIWSYFAMPSSKKDYVKLVKTAVRDTHMQLNAELNDLRLEFIESKRSECRKWLRGILDDRDEIVKFLRRLNPENKTSLTKVSLEKLQITLIEDFLSIVFYEGIKGNNTGNSIESLIRSSK